MSAEQINYEYEQSKEYELDTFAFSGVTLVELSTKNVAKVEAMIRTDSKYRLSLGNDYEDKEYSPYWIEQLGKLLREESADCCYEKVICKIVDLLDKENGTHLTADLTEDKKTDASKVMKKRILELKNRKKDILKFLENPSVFFNKTDLDLIEILSAPTKEINNEKPRRHLSFASKFCHYTCFHIFKDQKARDNFSIYDKFVLEALPYYLKYYKENGKIDNEIVLKKENGNSHYKFSDFQKVVDEIIKASDSKISRNGFDHLLWYYFKGDRLKKEKALKKRHNDDRVVD